MKEELITIVVPVYNVEKYLCACIESILEQTYERFELILVDDGSTDSSGLIIDRYNSIDKRVVVVHKDNGGLSSARNVGIEQANGKYITFIDSDDYISHDFLECLYKTVKKNNAEIGICDFVKVEETRELVDCEEYKTKQATDYIFSFEESIKQVYHNKYHGMDFVAWAKIYKTELFLNSGIRYPEGKLHEDTFTTYKIFYSARSIVYVDVELYYYRIRQGSITTSEFKTGRLDMLIATREECAFLRDNGYNDLVKLAFVAHLHSTKSMMRLISRSSGDKQNSMKVVCKGLKRDLCEYRSYISVFRFLYYTGLACTPRLFLMLG